MQDNKQSVFNTEIDEIFKIIGKDSTSIYMYLLKHLNRHHRCILYVPKWFNNKWQNSIKMEIKEIANGYLNNREVEKQLRLQENSLGDKKYTIFFRTFNIETGVYEHYGFEESRKDLWATYITALENAIKLRKMQTGADTIIS